MQYKPIKGTQYSRRMMGLIFLGCGLLMAAVHVLAGGMFLILAAVILYYAPRWDLLVEIQNDIIRFSENVVETVPVELSFSEVAEVRRVEEKENRKGIWSFSPAYHGFLEFETRDGRLYRMHDIFPDELDEDLKTALGVERAKLDTPAREEAGPENV